MLVTPGGDIITGAGNNGSGGFIRWDSVGNHVVTYLPRTEYVWDEEEQDEVEVNLNEHTTGIFHTVINATGGGYLALQTLNNTSSGPNSGAAIYLFDEEFELIRMDTLGGSGSDGLENVSATPDGGYIFTGYTDSDDGHLQGVNLDPNAINRYVWVVKTDADLNVEWQRVYGGKKSLDTTPSANFWLTYAGDRFQNGTSIIPTSDQGYLFSATTTIDNGTGVDTSFGESDLWVAKLAANGDLQWGRVYGGPGMDGAYSIVEITDGNYVLLGSAIGYGGMVHTPHPGGVADLWALKLDAANGDTLWTRSLGGEGLEETFRNAMFTTADGGVVIGGFTRSTMGDVLHFGQANKGVADVWVFKLDSDGEFVWNRVLGSANSDESLTIAEARDGGVIVAARTNAQDSGDVPPNAEGTEGTGHAVWMFKLAPCPQHVAVTAHICANEPYDLNGTLISEAGIYTASLQTTYGCDSIITLTLTTDPVVTTALEATICSGETYTFGTQVLNATGLYTDTLTSLITGCDSLLQLTLTVEPTDQVDLNAAICAGENYLFHGVELTETGTFEHVLQNSGGCDSVVVLTLTVHALPSATITANGVVLSTGTFAGYQWRLDGEAIPGATAQTWTATENGTYSVDVTDENGCTATSVPFVLNSVGIASNASEDKLNIRPNPVHDRLWVDMPAAGHITLNDASGRVLARSYATSTGPTSLSVSDLPSGVYVLIVDMPERGRSTHRVVKD